MARCGFVSSGFFSVAPREKTRRLKIVAFVALKSRGEFSEGHSPGGATPPPSLDFFCREGRNSFGGEEDFQSPKRGRRGSCGLSWAVDRRDASASYLRRNEGN